MGIMHVCVACGEQRIIPLSLQRTEFEMRSYEIEMALSKRKASPEILAQRRQANLDRLKAYQARLADRNGKRTVVFLGNRALAQIAALRLTRYGRTKAAIIRRALQEAATACLANRLTPGSAANVEKEGWATNPTCIVFEVESVAHIQLLENAGFGKGATGVVRHAIELASASWVGGGDGAPANQ